MLNKLLTKIASNKAVQDTVTDEQLLKDAVVVEQHLIGTYKQAEIDEATLTKEFAQKYAAGTVTAGEAQLYNAAVSNAQMEKNASYTGLEDLYGCFMAPEVKAGMEKKSAAEEAFVAGYIVKTAQMGEVPEDVLNAIVEWISQNPEIAGSLLGGGAGGIAGGLAGGGMGALGGALGGAGLGAAGGSLF